MKSPLSLRDDSAARTASRHATQLSCEILPEGAGAPLFGTVTDLSLTGARAMVDRPLEHGSDVLLCFRPPRSAEDVLLGATIVHLDTRARGETIVGLAFTALEAEMRAFLEESLSHLPPRLPRLEDDVVEIVDLDEEMGSGVNVLFDAIVVDDEVSSSTDDEPFVPLRDSEIEILRVAS